MKKLIKRMLKGKTIINALNLETLEYKPAISPKLEIVKSAKGIGLSEQKIKLSGGWQLKRTNVFQRLFCNPIGIFCFKSS